jgi:hypothetical protein
MYAVWERTHYELIYNFAVNGGTSRKTPGKSFETAMVETGSEVNLQLTSLSAEYRGTIAFETTGWYFIGWTDDQGGTEPRDFYTMQAENATLFAVYMKTLEATFIDYDGEATVSYPRQTGIYNPGNSQIEIGNIPAPQQSIVESWTPTGWTIDPDPEAGAVPSGSGLPISNDITYYGLYERTVTLSYDTGVNTYTPSGRTVTQKLNSGNPSAYTNATVILAAPVEKTGYSFDCWVNEETGEKYEADIDYLISTNTTMVATWTAARTAATQQLLSWLNRENPTPALGGHWSGMRNWDWKAAFEPEKYVGWKEQEGLLEKEPLLFSFEYFDKELVNHNSMGHEDVQKRSRDGIRNYIINKYENGGIVTIVAHMPNFNTARQYQGTEFQGSAFAKKGNAWDRETDVIGAILTDGSVARMEYIRYLNDMAAYFESLTYEDEPIPILFRPFHEMNGSWFWWGADARVKELWKFTWHYLTDTKGLRNLVWVWSVNIDPNNSPNPNLDPYWPGSGYVDVVAMDGYLTGPETTMLNPSGQFSRMYNALALIAQREGLPIAISEFGFSPDSYKIRREPEVWQSKLPDFLNSLEIKPSYFLIWSGLAGPEAFSYANELEMAEDRENFRNFVLYGNHGEVMFLLLGDQ